MIVDVILNVRQMIRSIRVPTSTCHPKHHAVRVKTFCLLGQSSLATRIAEALLIHLETIRYHFVSSRLPGQQRVCGEFLLCAFTA
jgi:hypothetical protein